MYYALLHLPLLSCQGSAYFTLGSFMFLNNTTLMVVAVFGIIVTLIGMGFRDRNPGIILMGIGFLATLFAIIQKAIKTFS